MGLAVQKPVTQHMEGWVGVEAGPLILYQTRYTARPVSEKEDVPIN